MFRKVSPSVQPTSSDAWRQEILPYFVNSLILPDTTPSTERTAVVMDLLTSTGPGSVAFRDAIMATSAAYFARRRKRSELHSDTLRLYVKALSSLNKSLSVASEIPQDITLITVTILAIRDFIVGENATAQNSHCATELRVLRNTPPMSVSGQGYRSNHVHSVMRIRSAIRSLWDSTCTPILLPSDFPDVPDHFCDIITKVNGVCSVFKTASSTTSDLETITRHVEYALKLDDQLRQIVTHLSRKHHYSTVAYNDPNPATSYSLLHAYVFGQMHSARSWTLLWCCRLKILDALEARDFTVCLGLDSKLLPVISERTQDRVTLASHICAAIPYMLDEVNDSGNLARTRTKPADPGDVLCPVALYVAGCSTSTSPPLRSWIVQQLNYIGSERGIGQAFHFMRDLIATHQFDLQAMV